jgi:hypothetical protein
MLVKANKKKKKRKNFKFMKGQVKESRFMA